MRIRTLRATDPRSENEIKIQFSKGDLIADNFFSILIGENGTRKSQSLRDILDLSFTSITRLRQTGLAIENKSGTLTYWASKRAGSPYLPSKVIAVSGVATDRFPSRLSGRLRKNEVRYSREDRYHYIGPRSESNLVSRSQSLQEIVRMLIENYSKVSERQTALSAAFDVLPTSKGCLFNFRHNVEVKRGQCDVESLSYALHDGEPSKAKRFELAPEELKQQVVLLMNSDFPLEVKLDLDDEDSTGISPDFSAEVFALALDCGAITVDDSYSLMPSGAQLPLSEFSSGQWHIFSSLLFVALAVENDALILVDEPENSLHPHWQREYLTLFSKAVSSCEGVHVLVATHSPLVASALPQNRAQVIRLSRTRYGNLVAKELASGPFGWTADDILEEVFALPSTRSQLFAQELDRTLKLFAKGDRQNEELIQRVKKLVAFSSSLPEDDIARGVIETLRTVILPDAQAKARKK
jgi:predicted ATP-binding protein involved in virulence